MGKSRPASSAAAAREKDVTNTDAGPYRSTARRIWRVRLVVLPVPGGPKMRYSDVTLWSLWPISSSVPVACSLGIGFLLARRVLSGIKLIHRQHPPALLLELRAADTDALATKYPEHRGERLDGQVLERGLVDIHLQVAGADGDFAVQQDGFPLVLDLLPFQRVDEAGLREVVRHVHPRRALPLDLFAALLDDAGIQHDLRQLLPDIGLEFADQLPDRSGNGKAHAVLRDELADVGELDLSLLQFHVEGGFLARELHNAADPD